MRKNKYIQKEIHGVNKRDPLLNAASNGIYTKSGNHLKKLVFLVCLAGAGLFFNSCATGYITYHESERTARPGSGFIWINGDWIYDNQTNAYIQKTGYWEIPGKDRKFVPGRWQSTPRGHHWTSGYWVTIL